MCAALPAALRPKKLTGSEPKAPNGRRFLPLAGLVLLSAAAILIAGYHPFAEDAEIYVPGIKKLLAPALYPANDEFFLLHARMTVFPNLIAASVRWTHIGLDWMLLAWQFVLIFLLLVAAWKLGRLAFDSERAAWGSSVLLAALLTIPVAGTALYIMDQYVNTRSFSTPAALWTILFLAERKTLRAIALALITAIIHPLMALYTLAFAGVFLYLKRNRGRHLPETLGAAWLILPWALPGAIAAAYRQALASRPYFFPVRWAWYEWLGFFGPLAVLFWFSRAARRRQQPIVQALAGTAITYAGLFLFLALAITIPPQFLRLVELQPMRSLEIVYLLVTVLGGGLLAEKVLGRKPERWLLLFAPLSFAMFYAQRQLFPQDPHLEWPGRTTENRWVEAFLWIRQNTPAEAYFALDPDHMRLRGEDQQGFRSIAERSMLADLVKDSGAVTMFPSLAPTWLEQVRDQENWKHFGIRDFARLKEKYGIDWLVLEQPGISGLECPYRNSDVLVCHLADERSLGPAQ